MLGEIVVGIYVGLVVFAMVKLHDLAGDGGLESAIVIYSEVRSEFKRYLEGSSIHGRSGRVALPRAKEGMIAGWAILETEVKLRRPLRTVD